MKNLGRDLIRKIKESPLIGEEAHKIYAPPQRPFLTYDEILSRKPKFAAVNILLYLKNEEWFFPLMLRTQNEHDRHSGQISLPGGKKEDNDENFAKTAIRETAEEIGIEPEFIRIIREISPIYIPPSNFYVYPFISFTKKNPKFRLQESEAVELIEFPVKALLSLPNTPKIEVIPTSKGIEVPVMNIAKHSVWGATSMILNEFRHLLKNL